MHKAVFLEGILELTIRPAGPILIKAGESGGADPTRPDMEFVRTRRHGREQVYIPGSSLKGVLRAQCERICRSLDRPGRDPEADNPPLSDNPLGNGKTYGGIEDLQYSSGKYSESIRDSLKNNSEAIVYRRSSLTSRMFGHTAMASHVRFADAYADDEPLLEERNGVAIDRVYGSVAVGPFNFETVVSGSFNTRILLRNLSLAQFGLLGLALRDLAEGRIGVGFGKSRGLGRVQVTLERLELRYPACEVSGGELRLLGGTRVAADSELAGIGALCSDAAYRAYHLPAPETDRAKLPAGLAYVPDDLLGVRLEALGDTQIRAVWRVCMPAWRKEIGL